ncbi:hypothetical protein A2955_04200 [Candidatus Woesebacteria bacterium RIFCSPLOWO2_01_FULL_37_19]|uniref:Uncharacterized protein n=1 Tax=Candidatus Woesebacteria bacterium RIFCSPLOWO2_01_FULL_37_19 TaxID=1802514 RepID=A0A1F8B0J6_9BACT|nr:MAG: hypothetical protein A2955_04200 [Candidatus Woesebacteria bacterium RIFCSPLOWO2_01_FULL_37_19]
MLTEDKNLNRVKEYILFKYSCWFASISSGLLIKSKPSEGPKVGSFTKSHNNTFATYIICTWGGAFFLIFLAV